MYKSIANVKYISTSLGPKIKLSLFPQTRPTRENRPDSNNFFAIFFEELFFPDFSIQPLPVCSFTMKCHMNASFIAISFKRQVNIDLNGGVQLVTWRADERDSFLTFYASLDFL